MTAPTCVRLLHAEPDDRLLALAREGHERAFEALVQRYREPLLAHCKRVLPAARAEDAVQQGLLQAWLALHRGTDVRDVKPWLYQIVHNTAIRMQRAPATDQAPLTDEFAAPGTPHSDLERQIAARDVLQRVAALPELQREVLLQTALRGRTNDQVAAALGLSNDSVRGLLYRARTKLRAAASGLIPSPFVVWAMRIVGKRATSVQLPSGSGSTAEAGIAGMVARGGAVAVTVAALAVGGQAVHSHLWLTDARGAGQYGNRAAWGARTAYSRVDADPADVDSSAGSTILMAARSGAHASGVRASGTTPGGAIPSISHSGGSSGHGGTGASFTPRHMSRSDAPTSTSTGGDSTNGRDDSGSDGSDTSATPPTPPADASGEDHTSSESSDNSDGSTASERGRSHRARHPEEESD